MLAATTIGSEARERLGSILGIGPAIAEELADFFANRATWKRSTNSPTCCASTPPARGAEADSPVAGKTLVFTGTLETMSRPEAKARAEALGCEGHGIGVEEDRFRGGGRRCRVEGAQGAELGVRILTEAEWRDLAGMDAAG